MFTVSSPMVIACTMFALAGLAPAWAKGGHGGHGHGGSSGGVSAISLGQGHLSGASGAVRPVGGGSRPAASGSRVAGTGCGGRDERGNCLAPRLRDPDFSAP